MHIAKDHIYYHVPVHRLLEEIEAFMSLGIGCEIFIRADFIDSYSKEDISLINTAFDKHGLRRKVHGPFVDLNPGSTDIRVRELTLNRFLRTVKLCSMLKADSIVFHSHFEPIFYRRHFDEWLKNSEIVWNRVVDASEKLGISINIENSIDESPDAVLATLERHPSLGACFDVAHYNVFSPKGWKDAISRYPRGSIREVHVSDNKGNEDLHLPLGEGNIDFEEFFSEIIKRNEDPIITVEPHSKEGLTKNIEFMGKFAQGSD